MEQTLAYIARLQAAVTVEIVKAKKEKKMDRYFAHADLFHSLSELGKSLLWEEETTEGVADLVDGMLSFRDMFEPLKQVK